MKDALQSKGIQIIQIFINLIFDKLVEKLKNCKLIKTTEDRDKFEAEIEQVLEGAYKEYEWGWDRLGSSGDPWQIQQITADL